MLDHAGTATDRLLTRRCVKCGYDGPSLFGGRARRCPRCGCDLRQRPARSYAEMEGLLGMPLVVDRATNVIEPLNLHRLMVRWVAFLFLSALFVIIVGYLAAGALPP